VLFIFKMFFITCVLWLCKSLPFLIASNKSIRGYSNLPSTASHHFMTCRITTYCCFPVSSMAPWSTFVKAKLLSLSTPWSHVGRVDVWLHLFLSSALDAEWSVSRHGRVALSKEQIYPLTRRLGFLQSRSARLGDMKNPMPQAGFEPQTFSLLCSQYTDWGIRAVLHIYSKCMYLDSLSS
jgi:hypothetical protein